MQLTNLNVAPIFDDFDENKNYHRILFNAGKAVQARELTQAQTILQSQIERLGKHLFTEGAMVVPGGIKSIEDQDYIALNMNLGSTYADFSGETELFVKSNANGLVAKVAKSFDAAGADPVTLFIDTITPGSGQEKKFAVNEAITFFVYNSDGVTTRNIALATVSGKGKGSWVKVQNGVYFVRGMLVKTEDQEYVVSKYTTDKTVKVGFHVEESIITAADDISLYSNANGYPNQSAEGASRLKVVLTLVGIAVDTVDSNFIEIARFENGALQSKVDYTNYSIIEQSIAKRTYETNGDYIINEFGLDIKEHLKTGNNGGVYDVANGGDETKLVASIKPGIGYIKGYRVENIGVQNVAFDKARDSSFLNNATSTTEYGQYFLVTNMKSLPDMDIKKRLVLLDGGNVQVGTAAVRALRKDGAYYRVYVFDVSMNYLKSISDVHSIKYSDASSLFTADLTASVLYDANKSSLVFKLPVSSVKTLYTPGVGGDTSYTVLRTYNLSTNANGQVSVSCGSNEFFAAIDDINYFVGLTGSASAGTLYSPTASLTLGGTIQGTTLSVDLGVANANQSIKVVAPVIKSQTTQKTKSLMTVTDEAISFPDTNRQALSKADIYDIISVVDANTAEDLTSQFIFDDGQRDSWYQKGKLIKSDSQLIIRDVKVTYRYFDHSAGDYFTVDSYSGLTRNEITSYNGSNLSDFIDFRPLKDSNDQFSSSTVFGEIIKPGDSIRADITYYLPRADIVCVNANGDFSVVKGIPSLAPQVPATPFESMKLYELLIPAYTESTVGISIKSVDNRRYTMRDIGKLESRINNLEYYTTLSALESATNKTEVVDPVTGNNRFKNGFAVDGFTDYRLAELSNAEWSASMDLSNGHLNPSFAQNEVGFAPSTLNSVVQPSRVLMKSYTESAMISQPYATTTININPYAVFAWIGDVNLTPDRDYWKDVYYQQPIVVNNTVNLRANAVEGTVWGSWLKTTYDHLGGHRDWATKQYVAYETKTTFQEQTYSGSVDNIVETSVIPYMRSIPIDFVCEGFRPFTKLYPFWDSVDVSINCKPTGGNYGDAIITDSAGKATGTYLVPNSDVKKFKTGESVMRFTDSSTDDRDPNVLTTYGSTKFLSGGVSESRQTTTTNTKVLTATTVPTGEVRYIDPIAQTFTIPTSGGCFVTKFDIFFASKARSIPVTLQLRTAGSGLPTAEVIASKRLTPDLVSTSVDGTAATSFVFDDPVYLVEGNEYAIVLVADTQEYNVYLAEQGQNVIGSNMALSKQAHMGVFLTSSNGSTWNAQQNRDMKFTAYRAVFGTGAGSVVFDCNTPDAIPMPFNALYSTNGSNIVKVVMPSHGLKVGDKVVIAGAVEANNLVDAGINGNKTVLSADLDTFTYQATTAANLDGSFGGSAMTAEVNFPFNILVNNVDAFTPDGTSVVWEYRYKSQSTRVVSAWTPLAQKVNNKLDAEGVVIGSGDLQIRATVDTSQDNLSPMIESSGFNAVLVSPRVDGTSKVFNYVTQDIKFDNPTSHARFYVGAKLPGNAGMKFYIKEIDTSDQDVSTISWTELVATNPISNSENYVEYEYQLDGSFVGYKIKVELTGSRDNPPSLSDIRTLAFA